MYGLVGRELRFALLISSAHFSQHVYYRILPPLIPVLAVALEYPLWQLGLLITLYSLGMGVVQAPLGILSDRYDRLYLLPSGIAITGLAYVLFAFAPTLGGSLEAVTLLGHTFEGGFLIMSLSMVGVGVGLSVVHPVGYPMITDNVSIQHKGKVLGLFGASSKLGDATAPAIIAGLILILPWHYIIQLFGFAGLVYGLALFIVLSRGPYVTIPSGQRERQLTEGRVKRHAYIYPMVVVYAFFITSGLATVGLNSFLPTFIVDVYEFSLGTGRFTIGPESVANLYFALLLLSGAVMQLILGAIADRRDPRVIMIGCMVIATIGVAILATVGLNPVMLVVVIVALGAGLYGVNPARDALISELSPPEREGRTFGYVFTAVTLTAAPLPTVIGYLLDTVGMRTGFALLTIGPILAGGTVCLLYSDRVYHTSNEAATGVGPSD